MPKLVREFSQDTNNYRVVTDKSGKDYVITLEEQNGLDAMGATRWTRALDYRPYDGSYDTPSTAQVLLFEIVQLANKLARNEP